MKYFYHYTHDRFVDKIKQTGIYPNHPYFTTTEYYTPREAGQSLGVMPNNINCVLKFKDDGLFKTAGIVPTTNRFTGGGIQFSHPLRPKPIASRKISDRSWQNL